MPINMNIVVLLAVEFLWYKITSFPQLHFVMILYTFFFDFDVILDEIFFDLFCKNSN